MRPKTSFTCTAGGYGSRPSAGRRLWLRPVRRVDHRLAQVLLRAVDLGGGVAALDVAVLAAGDVFGGADGNIVGAADRIVVLAEAGDGDLVAGGAGGERQGGECEGDEVRSHTVSQVRLLAQLFSRNCGNCKSPTTVIPGRELAQN